MGTELKASARRSSADLVELHLSRLDAGNYHYAISHAGCVLFEDAGFTSIAEAITAAAADGTDFSGLQVAYRGIVAGTYTSQELFASSAAVAELCVERGALFNGEH